MSEEKEEREGWFNSLTTIRKFHPVAFTLASAMMYLFSKVLQSSTPLPEKITFLASSGTIYTVTLFFEFYRIDKERELKEKRGFFVNDEKRVLKLLGVTCQRASHIPLKNGVVKVNPHLRVLCPVLASGRDCHKGFKNYKGKYHRPKLLIKNYGDPCLQLWMCEGCKDKFLLRVKF